MFITQFDASIASSSCFVQLFGNSQASIEFWQQELKVHLQCKFLDCLTQEESRPSFNLVSIVPKFPLLVRLLKSTGILLRPELTQVSSSQLLQRRKREID